MEPDIGDGTDDARLHEPHWTTFEMPRDEESPSEFTPDLIAYIHALYVKTPQVIILSEIIPIMYLAGVKVGSDYMVFYRCDDAKGNFVAIRGCVIMIPFGWDLMAATSSAGRQMSASYSLLWEVFQRCQEAGVKRYDMMGVDPRHHPGVYHFKKGTGAEFVDYLGEGEWAPYPPLRWCANWMLRYSHAAFAHSRVRL